MKPVTALGANPAFVSENRFLSAISVANALISLLFSDIPDAARFRSSSGSSILPPSRSEPGIIEKSALRDVAISSRVPVPSTTPVFSNWKEGDEVSFFAAEFPGIASGEFTKRDEPSAAKQKSESAAIADTPPPACPHTTV